MIQTCFKMLNAGCGSTYHQDWVNIDLISDSPFVIAHDLTKGLPFPSGTFDACYSSHVLEHLPKKEGLFFMAEQKRVLKKGGILRVAVPDLEAICRNYIRYLDELLAGNSAIEFRYDYTALELFDQITRDTSGGELGRLLALGVVPDWDFVISRHGQFARASMEMRDRLHCAVAKQSLAARLRRAMTWKGARNAFDRLRQSLAARMVWLILGRRGTAAFREGLFRKSGEIHQTMYDRYSLGRLMALNGFTKISPRAAGQSEIPRFAEYGLEIAHGEPIKPDSLYMEGLLAD